MVSVIKGIPVILDERQEIGVDELNRPVYQKVPVTVDNVLICPVTSDAIVDTTSMTGKKLVYELCISKGDTHNWHDTTVHFWGQTWNTVGYPVEYMEQLVPLDWNRKVKVERYG